MGNQQNTQLYRRYIAQLATAYRDRSDIRMFVEMLLTSLAVFLFSVFAIRPTLVTIGGLTTEISEKQDTINTMDTKINNLIAAQDLYTKNNTTLALLDTAVPADPSIAQYIKQIESVASAHSVSVFTLNTNNIPIDTSSQVGGSEQKVTLSITFSGDYSSLLATLKDLESLRRPFLPTTNALSLDESNTNSQLFLSVTGDAPYWPIEVPQNPTQ